MFRLSNRFSLWCWDWGFCFGLGLGFLFHLPSFCIILSRNFDDDVDYSFDTGRPLQAPGHPAMGQGPAGGIYDSYELNYRQGYQREEENNNIRYQNTLEHYSYALVFSRKNKGANKETTIHKDGRQLINQARHRSAGDSART